MKYIDAKEKLTIANIRAFVKELKDDDILIQFTDKDDSEVELTCSKESLIHTLFDRTLFEGNDENAIVYVANTEVILETTKGNIYKLSTPSKIKKMLPIVGIVPEEETKQEEDFKEDKKLSTVIAMGLLKEDTIIEIEYLEVDKENIKDGIKFLNEGIQDSVLNKEYDSFRVNINYDLEKPYINLEEWFTIDELMKKGIIK